MTKLTEGTPIKLILRFAIPIFIGRLFQLFYSLVDTRIVGSILGETALRPPSNKRPKATACLKRSFAKTSSDLQSNGPRGSPPQN